LPGPRSLRVGIQSRRERHDVEYSGVSTRIAAYTALLHKSGSYRPLGISYTASRGSRINCLRPKSMLRQHNTSDGSSTVSGEALSRPSCVFLRTHKRATRSSTLHYPVGGYIFQEFGPTPPFDEDERNSNRVDEADVVPPRLEDWQLDHEGKVVKWWTIQTHGRWLRWRQESRYCTTSPGPINPFLLEEM
jgi:hypothetical protein